MGGSRALVAADGLVEGRLQAHQGADFDTEPWELYHLASDSSECNDLAAEQPDKLAELIDLWWQEAERHGVLPLDDRMFELFGARFRDHSPHPPTALRLPAADVADARPGVASIGGRSFDLTARVTRAAGDEGVLFATGTENSGISVFVQNDRLVVDYNAFDDHTVVESDVAVPAGDGDAGRQAAARSPAGRLDAARDRRRTGGTAELPLFMRMMSSVGPSIGYDHGSPVSTRYEAPFPFAGTLHEVEIQLLSQAGRDARQPRPRQR